MSDQSAGTAGSPLLATEISTDTVRPIVDRIEVALKGADRVPALCALTAVLLILQDPTIGPERIHAGVLAISQYVTLWLEGSADGSAQPLPASAIN